MRLMPAATKVTASGAKARFSDVIWAASCASDTQPFSASPSAPTYAGQQNLCSGGRVLVDVLYQRVAGACMVGVNNVAAAARRYG